MRFRGFDDEHRPRDYEAIINAAIDPETLPTEVSFEEYDYMLNVLPPMYIGDGQGFLVREAMCDSTLGPIHAMYTVRHLSDGPRYYGKWVVRGRPDTYIKNVTGAYARSEVDDQIAKSNHEASM